MIASDIGSTLQGVGTLITGAAALIGAWHARAARRSAKATNIAIEEKVIPAVTNHEAMLQQMATMSGLATVFMEDYKERKFGGQGGLGK